MRQADAALNAGTDIRTLVRGGPGTTKDAPPGPDGGPEMATARDRARTCSVAQHGGHAKNVSPCDEQAHGAHAAWVACCGHAHVAKRIGGHHQRRGASQRRDRACGSTHAPLNLFARVQPMGAHGGRAKTSAPLRAQGGTALEAARAEPGAGRMVDICRRSGLSPPSAAFDPA